jgi:site-specific DNA recombinase
MKKAVYYARVSTSLQEERGTIESQKTELIKQIKADGNILVKEYLDDGWSGARLDRPALDEFRRDLKTDLFEMVYFLDSDRIARDSTYQQIIISEILKYGKQIVIKGKDYIHNPENKFTLQVLGAVNELEKAKIVERTQRGKRERARNNEIMGSSGLYGYDYVAKTNTTPGHYVINNEEAEAVRLMFSCYADYSHSISGLVSYIESKKFKNKSGDTRWGRSVIYRILKNTSYYGVQYYNRSESIESNNLERRYSKNIKTRKREREEKEWIPVKIPAIIDKELFDKVQVRLSYNGKRLRNAVPRYLLSGLVKCGNCNHTYTGYIGSRSGTEYYRCNYRNQLSIHDKEAKESLHKCDNRQIVSDKLETAIWDAVENEVLKPSIVKKHIDFLCKNKDEFSGYSQKKLDEINAKLEAVELKKARVLDLYADGKLDKDLYMTKIDELVNVVNLLRDEGVEIEKKMGSVNNRKVILKDIKEYCLLAKKRLKKLDQNKKNGFLKEIINEIVLFNNNGTKAIIRGILPLNLSESSCGFAVSSIPLKRCDEASGTAVPPPSDYCC